MKVAQVISLLQQYSTLDEEVMIQWWTKKDTESSMGGLVISPEVWSEAVQIWDNEPQGAREAGIMECVRSAKDVIRQKIKKESVSKFTMLIGGKENHER